MSYYLIPKSSVTVQIRLGGFKNREREYKDGLERRCVGGDLRGVRKGEYNRSPLYELLRELIN